MIATFVPGLSATPVFGCSCSRRQGPWCRRRRPTALRHGGRPTARCESEVSHDSRTNRAAGRCVVGRRADRRDPADGRRGSGRADGPARRAGDESLRLRFFAVSREASHRYVDHLVAGSGDTVATLVATIGGTIVAVRPPSAWRRTSPKRPSSSPTAEHRHGLGGLLLEHLAAACRDAGSAASSPTSCPTTQPMIRVFRDAGFTLSPQATRRRARGDEHGGLGQRGRGRRSPRVRVGGEVAGAAAPPAHGRGRRRTPRWRGTGPCRAHLHPRGRLRRRRLRRPPEARLDRRRDRACPSWRTCPATSTWRSSPYPPLAFSPRSRTRRVPGCPRSWSSPRDLGELGPEGAAMQREMLRTAREHNIRLVGPNCLGVMVNDPEIRLNATFSRSVPTPGGLAIASQSGGVGIALLDVARELGVGVSSFISLGNKADVSGNDLLAAWLDDPAVTGAALYLESFGNAPKFARIARRFAERKPLLAVVGGRSAAARRAGARTLPRPRHPRSASTPCSAQAGVIALQECRGDGPDRPAPARAAAPVGPADRHRQQRRRARGAGGRRGGRPRPRGARAVARRSGPSSTARCPARPAPATPSTSGRAPRPTNSRGWSSHCSPRRRWTHCSSSWCRPASRLRNRSSSPGRRAGALPRQAGGPGRAWAVSATVPQASPSSGPSTTPSRRSAMPRGTPSGWPPRGPPAAPYDPERADAARTARASSRRRHRDGSGWVDAADVPRLLQPVRPRGRGRHRARTRSTPHACRRRVRASPSSSRSPTATSSTRPTAAWSGSG